MAITSSSVPSSAYSQFPYSNSSYFPVPFHLQQSAATVASQYAAPYVAAVPTLAPPVIVPIYPASAPAAGVYSLPHYHQAVNVCGLFPAQQLFQRDAQTITPEEALESVKAAIANNEFEHKTENKKKAIPRKAAGQTWEDPTLAEWPEDDYGLFCGDLGNEVNDDVLSKAFSHFPSFNKARRYKRTGKTKGYGFVSFANPSDLATALKELNGKYVGNQPVKLRKSKWKESTDFEALEKQKAQVQKKTEIAEEGCSAQVIVI